jgi:hypothetical protein
MSLGEGPQSTRFALQCLRALSQDVETDSVTICDKHLASTTSSTQLHVTLHASDAVAILM